MNNHNIPAAGFYDAVGVFSGGIGWKEAGASSEALERLDPLVNCEKVQDFRIAGRNSSLNRLRGEAIMQRRAAKIDNNQTSLVNFMRSLGASVSVTSSAGKGFTDTVVGFCGMTCLCEIKDPEKALSKRVLTLDQREFHADWKGRIFTVETEHECAVLLRDLAKEGATIAQNRQFQLSAQIERGDL